MKLSVTRLFWALLALMFFAIADAARADDGGRPAAGPTGFFYGGAVGLDQAIYEDYDSDPVVLPIIGYIGGNLQVFGPEVKYVMLRRGAFGFDLRLAARFDGYDDSDSDVFRGMDEREDTIDAGLGMTWEQGSWKFEIAGLYDTLDRSNGYEWSTELGKTYGAGQFMIEPTVGLSYLDSRLVDYYYGVEADEAAIFRPAYSGDSTLNSKLGLKFTTLAYFGGITRVGFEYNSYASEISDSPLTDEDSSFGMLLSFSKFF